MNFEPQNLTN